jgi:FMN phosphatase YigB (HAD superfamily)
MNTLKAVIFDVYETLLNVSHPEEDTEVSWEKLHAQFFGAPPQVTLDHLAERCRHLVSEDHAHAHEFGIWHPEVVWSDIMRQALPAFATLTVRQGEDFLYRHIQLLRSLTLAPECARIFSLCVEKGVLLGVASNAQPYTLREMDVALSGIGRSMDLFQKDLTMWSFENGFSKPDPHIFRILAFRLERRGIRPEQAIVIGDRMDNDIEPARAQGFQTWWLNESHEGDWQALWDARFAQAAASQQTP